MINLFAAVSPPRLREGTPAPVRGEVQAQNGDRGDSSSSSLRSLSPTGGSTAPPPTIEAQQRASSTCAHDHHAQTQPSTQIHYSRTSTYRRSPSPTPAAPTSFPSLSIQQSLSSITSLLLKNDSAERTYRRTMIDTNDNISERLENIEDDLRERREDWDHFKLDLMESVERSIEGRLERFEKNLMDLINATLQSQERDARMQEGYDEGEGIQASTSARADDTIPLPVSFPTAVIASTAQVAGTTSRHVSRSAEMDIDTTAPSPSDELGLYFGSVTEDVDEGRVVINYDIGLEVELGHSNVVDDDVGAEAEVTDSYMNMNGEGDVPAPVLGIDPKDIMRGPAERISIERGTRESTEATRRESVRLNKDQDDDSGPDERLVTPRVDVHNNTALAPAHAGINLTDVVDEQLVDQDGTDQLSQTNSKPPPRLPFPPRPNVVDDSSTLLRPKRAAAERKSLSVVRTSLPTPKPNRPTPSRSASSQYDISQKQTPSSVKRKRARRSHSGQESNSAKRAKATPLRTFKGVTRVGTKYMPASDGIKKTDAIWPAKGENTRRGRLAEIVCDVCRGRCHWNCAGLAENLDMTNETWICPDCKYIIAEQDVPRVLIDTVQQVRCIRWNCILREKQAIVPDDGDPLYVVEKVVGRRATGRVPGEQSRTFEYLVKWDGYEMEECTWEPPAHLEPHIQTRKEEFASAAKKENLDTKRRVALLREAWKSWDRETGKYKGPRESSQVGSDDESEQGGASLSGEDGQKVRSMGFNAGNKDGGVIATRDGSQTGDVSDADAGDSAAMIENDDQTTRTVDTEADMGGEGVDQNGPPPVATN
ncbi:hypothetical protein IAR55_000407 [Kwoniella newhampshirensis]|uniref:Chromo domain-containing protein n=1 Tax=Kwoniella newhampshirensis TaxID=1651941 RepID=A0AAW0Z6Q5_9TREE